MSVPANMLSRRPAWTLVFVLFCTSVVSLLDRNILSLFVGPIRSEIGLTDTQVSLLQGVAFALFYAAMGLPFGRVVDRYTRRNLIAAGVLLWSLMTIACGLSTGFWQLFFARMGVGIGEACLGPAAFSMIADCFTHERRGRALAAYNMSNYVGVGCSLLFGGLVISILGKLTHHGWFVVSDIQTWRIAFIVAAIPGILIAIIVMTMKEPERQEMVRTSNGVRFLSYLRPRKPTFTCVYTVYTLTATIAYIIVAWAPSLYIRHFHIPPADVGWIMGAVSIGAGVCGCLVAGHISDALVSRGVPGGRFRVPLLWWPIAVISIIGMTRASSATVSLFFLGLLTFGSALAFSTAAAVIQDIVPNQFRGQAAAMNSIFTGLIGLSLGPTSVAMVTDYVLKDGKLIGTSLLVVIVPIAIAGFIACIAGQKSYQRTRSELLEWINANQNHAAKSGVRSIPSRAVLKGNLEH
ncbi:major facilitator superfamily MFS_1 [Paraburkholderia atlantica]|uniref:Major facilitator superfamily MFS_1 n=1 Tax=Paraburkholderia atlantica TaxID=2654982 RepID=D5WI79_PARAM|nr:MFS transporter [Paraburkholderia atlantica]ADG18174.1 major facilitator superfamily MFS_1 [Paraburkholderia atlantica]